MVTIKHTRESIAELEKERDQYKRERDESNKEVVRVMEKLIVSEDTAEDYKFGYREMKKQRDELIEDLSNYRRVLKVFARLIKNKLDIKASDRYIHYKDMLGDIGINTDDLERE